MRELSGIDTVVMQVCDVCPFSCPQCYAGKGNTYLPVEQAELLLDRTFRGRSGTLQITGGEPMLYPELEELIAFCANRNVATYLATSGYGCTQEKVRVLQAAGLSCLCVSLNGSVKEVHEQTRQAYGIALEAIRNACLVGLPCMINWVACGSNADDFPNVLSLCRELGVCAVCIIKKYPDYSGMHTDYPSAHQLQTLKRVSADCRDVEVLVEECYSELHGQPTRCYAGETSYYVDCTGKVSPCSMVRTLRYTSPMEMLACENEWKGHSKNICRCDCIRNV